MQATGRKKGWTRTFSEEHIQKLRDSHKGITYPNRRPMSEEQKQKLRESWQKRVEQARNSNHKNTVSVGGYGLLSLNQYIPSATELCDCGRTYLLKLGCLPCRS